MRKTLRIRLWFVIIPAVVLVGFTLCAHAQGILEWDGYTVLAQDSSGDLHAAVVENPATGGRTLIITAPGDGGPIRAERAVPASWPAQGITVETAGDGTKPLYSEVVVKTPADASGTLYYVKILLLDDAWAISKARGEYAGRTYSIHRLADGRWQVTAYTGERFVELAPETIDQMPGAFDFEQAMKAAAGAMREKYALQESALRTMLAEAFPGTALAGGTPVDWDLRYDGDRLTAAAAAVRADGQTALCLWTLAEDGTWHTAVNWHAIPTAEDADTLWLQLSYDDFYDEILKVSLEARATEGNPEISFRLNEDGGWSLRYYSVTNARDEFWNAEINDGVMRIYAGAFYGEIGYLYADEDLQITAFEAFDPARFYAAMRAPYDAFMAGEPPLIPDDGSAYALPQPCGAALKKGTYDVYSGPGTQYYREADGKAAVSSNDWVQVFGTDGDWVLIQYRIDGPLLRFGYIRASALKDPAGVPELVLESVFLETTDNEFVTSNPLGLGGRLRFAYNGVPMTRLGTLGGFWMYVELTLPNGQPARMFAETQASHG